MAIEKFQFLNEEGMGQFATQLLTKVNSRIEERIVTELSENASEKQTLSAKALYAAVSAIQNAGDETDIAAQDAIKGRLDAQDTTLGEHDEAIEALQGHEEVQDGKLGDVETGLEGLVSKVGELVHLNVETITGSIDTVTEPKDDILYFQRDDANDTMWMLYIYQNGSWVNIGDTEVDLSVIWSKDETSELREALGIHDVESMTEDDITTIMEAAFAATEETL